MAEVSVQKDIKLTRAEREKETQAAAYQELMYEYPLPDNISEMKSFAIGAFTWRDVIFVGGSLLGGVILTLPLSLFIPQWLSIIIGLLVGIPFAFLSIKHVFTGDLPFEERVKIAYAERGKNNLLNWDKTKEANNVYVEAATQSFVPDIEFTEDNYSMLPNDEGGFAVLELSVDDITQSKNTELVGVVRSFKRMLDALIQENECTPIQIMLKSVPKNLTTYIDKAEECAASIEEDEKYVQAARADDYVACLRSLDNAKSFYHKYYIVITYREDAEKVAEDSMDTVSVRKRKMKEKAMSPLDKRAKDAQNENFVVGETEEERKRKMKVKGRMPQYGQVKTRDALERRCGVAMNMIRDMGSTHTDVNVRLLTRTELAKLIFDCYNTEDKHIVDSVINGAINHKNALYSASMYRDFPDMFSINAKEKKTLDKTRQRQKMGMLGSREE